MVGLMCLIWMFFVSTFLLARSVYEITTTLCYHLLCLTQRSALADKCMLRKNIYFLCDTTSIRRSVIQNRESFEKWSMKKCLLHVHYRLKFWVVKIFLLLFLKERNKERGNKFQRTGQGTMMYIYANMYILISVLLSLGHHISH